MTSLIISHTHTRVLQSNKYLMASFPLNANNLHKYINNTREYRLKLNNKMIFCTTNKNNKSITSIICN